MPPVPGVADHRAPLPPPSSPSPLPRSPHRGSTPQSPLRIKQDGKFYERLLTKESSAASAGGNGNLSFRYYWAEPGAVPFVWESQPGTPKDDAAARMMAAAAAGVALPAITPPPSYLLRHGSTGGGQPAVSSARHDHRAAARSSSKKNHKRRCRLKRIRIGFIAGIFRRLSLGTKRWPRPAAPPVKVSSSSSRWLFSSVATDQDEVGAAAAVAPHPKQHKAAAAAPCSFATLWMLRFRNSSSGGGDRGGRNVDGCSWA